MALTIEQKQIIEMVKDGKTNRAIADTLGYSERTIKRKLQTLYISFGATNKASLIVAVLACENRGFCDY